MPAHYVMWNNSLFVYYLEKVSLISFLKWAGFLFTMLNFKAPKIPFDKKTREKDCILMVLKCREKVVFRVFCEKCREQKNG